MKELDHNYNCVDEVIKQLGTGLIIVHSDGSGTFVMLKKLIEIQKDERDNLDTILPKIFSLNEDHQLYDEFNITFGLMYNSAILIICSAVVREVLLSPMSKSKLISSLKTIAS